MPDYSKVELFGALSANLSVEDLRQLCLYLSYNQRLENLRCRKLWHDPASVISDLLDLCERRHCLPLLVTTLQERFLLRRGKGRKMRKDRFGFGSDRKRLVQRAY